MKSSIFIVTDVPPDAGYTAGQVLHAIIASAPDIHFQLVWINQSGLPGHVTIPENCSFSRVLNVELTGLWLRVGHLLGRLGARSAWLHKLSMLVRTGMWLAKTALTGVRVGLHLRRSHARLAWFVVQGEKTVLCYAVASLICGKKLVLHQWDPVTWWMTHKNRPRKLVPLVRGLLDRLERRAALNIVPSDAWRDRLLAEDKQCIRLDNFFPDPDLASAGQHTLLVSEPSVVHAVFVGQFYSNNELDLLLEATGRALGGMGKSLLVHYFGSGSPAATSRYYRIVSHGAVSRDELVKRISKWDLALLPYPTEDRFADASSLSFPSKSRVYLAAGLPILSWTRKGASPDAFYRQWYGDHYHNAAQDDGLDAFLGKIAVATPEQRRERYSSAQNLVAQKFSYSSEYVPFKNFLLQNA
jgi:hypothetical protein